MPQPGHGHAGPEAREVRLDQADEHAVGVGCAEIDRPADGGTSAAGVDARAGIDRRAPRSRAHAFDDELVRIDRMWSMSVTCSSRSASASFIASMRTWCRCADSGAPSSSSSTMLSASSVARPCEFGGSSMDLDAAVRRRQRLDPVAGVRGEVVGRDERAVPLQRLGDRLADRPPVVRVRSVGAERLDRPSEIGLAEHGRSRRRRSDATPAPSRP